MTRLSVKAVLAATTMGQQVVVYGWLRTRRTSKNFSFLVINDGSAQDSLQIVADSKTQGYEQIEAFDTGVSLRVEGEIKASQGQQRVEVLARALTLLGDAPAYPLQKKGHTLEFLREQAHLRARTNTFGAVFRIKDSAARATHDFFHRQGFYWLHAPITTPSDCEGAGDLFAVTAPEAEVSGGERHFFWQARLSRGQRSTVCRGRGTGVGQGLHLRARPFAPRTPTPPAISPSFG